jgi:hypothetical protein
LNLISSLRVDADLNYLYTGEQKKLGAPRKYDGKVDWNNLRNLTLQYFGQFLIAYGRIRVSRLQGKFTTNGKSMVSEYELKTVRTIDTKSGLVTPVMMASGGQGRSIAIYVFMASGSPNALRGLECSAGARMLCRRSAHENR